VEGVGGSSEIWQYTAVVEGEELVTEEEEEQGAGGGVGGAAGGVGEGGGRAGRLSWQE
jgi:hypothetical protein